MANTETIKEKWERNQKAVKMRPEIGQKTVVTKVRLFNGTTCEVEHKHWKFKVDIGKAEGGNDAGPGPGILERGALGSCLAIGYSQQAAIMGVPVDSIEVDVESDLDARGMFAVEDIPPGFKELRYKVSVVSPAGEAEVMKVIEQTDKLSPVLDDFKRAIPVKRKVEISKSNT